VGEEDVDVALRVGLGLADRADHCWRPAVHPGRALRGRGGEHEAPRQVGADERDLLCDEAADREPEQVHLLEAHRLDEGDRAVSHRLDRVGRDAGGAAHADVVERGDASLRCEIVDERGVPVVEVAAEVLQQHERHLAGAELAVGVLDPVLCRDPLDLCVGITGVRAWRLSVCGGHEGSSGVQAAG
jgi:hypothetical protein